MLFNLKLQLKGLICDLKVSDDSIFFYFYICCCVMLDMIFEKLKVFCEWYKVAPLLFPCGIAWETAEFEGKLHLTEQTEYI